MDMLVREHGYPANKFWAPGYRGSRWWILDSSWVECVHLPRAKQGLSRVPIPDDR